MFSPWPPNLILCYLDAGVDEESHPKPPVAPQLISHLFRAVFRYHSHLPKRACPSFAQSLVVSRTSMGSPWVLVAGTALHQPKSPSSRSPGHIPDICLPSTDKACSWSRLLKGVRCASECCLLRCTLHASGCIQNANISNMHSQVLPVGSTYFIHQTKRHNCHLLKTCPKRYKPKLKALLWDLHKQNLLVLFCYVQS